jgi:hypothetical protein
VTTANFLRRLEEAQSGLNAHDNVARIKRAVIDEVTEVDPRVSVKNTDYFNHTYAPDLVLDWLGHRRSRYLYIRTDPNLDRLYEDVDILGTNHPVLFSLGHVTDVDQEQASQLAHASTESDVLVTDAFGLDAIAEKRREYPVIQLASAALLQGGRGLVGEELASQISDAFSSGFDGARRTELATTAAATETISMFFDSPSSRRLGQFLHAVWVGSGGASSSFPGQSDLSSDLPDEGFRFLLELDELDDADFWRRIGRRLTVERISRMDVDHASPNFQHLVQSNLDILWARICRILNSEETLFPQEGPFRWTRDAGMLALQGARFTAYVAEKTEMMRLAPQERRGISGEDLIQRADKLRRRVEQVDLSGPGCDVLYGSRSIDATHDANLHNILSTLGESVRVRAASVVIPEERSLRCDFETRTASGRGPATFPLADLVDNALRVLEELNSSEIQELDALFADWRRPPGQADLLNSI